MEHGGTPLHFNAGAPKAFRQIPALVESSCLGRA
jgi:hypothetical protein